MQTAVQWLEKRIMDMIEHGADFGEDLPPLLVHINQARELEKEQLIDAYMARMDMTDKEYFKQIIGVEYYNQTFKND